MRALSNSEWLQSRREAFRGVFATTDAFGKPLQKSMRARALLYPVTYLLDPEQGAAVVGAAREVGDDTFCVSITEGDNDFTDQSRHWELDYWEMNEYRELPLVGVLENAIYSPRGRWGLLISHEQHAVVGGTPEFIHSLKLQWPRFDESLSEFVKYWAEIKLRRKADTAWLEPLLAHLYGDKFAREAVAQVNGLEYGN